jgi:hypothetical protein
MQKKKYYSFLHILTHKTLTQIYFHLHILKLENYMFLLKIHINIYLKLNLFLLIKFFSFKCFYFNPRTRNAHFLLNFDNF